jgi:glutamine cyclotransferase
VKAALTVLAVLTLALPAGALAAAWSEHGFRVLERRPQSRELFVQGLEIHGDRLYMSTGRYGASQLLRFRLADGALEAGVSLPPDLWGEGLTLLGDDIYQLTWKAGRLLVFHRESLDFRRELSLPGEGWGVTHDGTALIYSDGSHLLHYLDPRSGERLGSVGVTLGGRPLPCLNELEWIDGRIWANVWLTDRIVMINPRDGTVEGLIDLAGLLPAQDRRRQTDVLNGIAYDSDRGDLWVTGKLWPWRYRIELLPPAPPPLSQSAGPIQYNAGPAPVGCVPYQLFTE